MPHLHEYAVAWTIYVVSGTGICVLMRRYLVSTGGTVSGNVAGGGGGFILSPSDHFFDANSVLIAAYADEARHCLYT